MKAITILQPWASLIACGVKRIETRSWATKYRGLIAIHAGKNLKYMDKAYDYPFTDYFKTGDEVSVGSVIAIADLVDCLLVNYCDFEKGEASLRVNVNNHKVVTGNEYLFGDFSADRYAWILTNVRPITPIPAKGRQRLWEWEDENIGEDKD